MAEESSYEPVAVRLPQDVRDFLATQPGRLRDYIEGLVRKDMERQGEVKVLTLVQRSQKGQRRVPRSAPSRVSVELGDVAYKFYVRHPRGTREVLEDLADQAILDGKTAWARERRR